MPHHTSLIAILCIGFVLAFVLGLIAQRLRLSPLVGYLVAGIIAGPFTPGFVADQTLAPQLAEIGVILLMFGVGLHFSLKDLMEVKAVAIPGAVAQITVVTLLGLGLSLAMGWPAMNGVVYGLALSVASTVVVLRALEERRLLETRRGRIAIGWLIVEDLAMVLALVLLPALAGAMNGGESQGIGSILAALGLTLLKVCAFIAVMLVVGKRAIPWTLERVAGTGSRELFTLCVLALAMGVAFGAAELFGVSFALGAFFAGMLLNESEFGHKAANDSLPMRDAFAVLFFVSVGMLFNPSILVDHPWLVLATFAIIILGNASVALLIVRMLKLPKLTALTIAVSLSQIGEFSFILASLGVDMGVLTENARDLILAGALLSIVANPFLFTLLDRWEARNAAKTVDPVDEPVKLPDNIVDHAIVVGFGRVGSQLAKLLQERGVPVVVIEDETDRVAHARAMGMPTIRGNAAVERVLLEAAPERAKLAVFAIPQALEAGETIARLKALNPEITVLARAHSDAEVKHLLAHGADGAVLAERELAYSLAEMVMATPPYRQLRTHPA
ncbi:YbaL family putative K(+) efflux transporter [Luteimonas panaciterrae]|uniref:YbaL family putative K(+) efflux transporter n=1 Tax=Luteimonas panaciterrae TaxID=363885 RepID=UPI001CF9E887|nr:YbaL family putative K(+) efflux transporter [Luteimonas panaciterrae]